MIGLDLSAVRLKDALQRIAVPLAKAARAFHGQRLWRGFGYKTAEDFARERLGRCSHWLGDLARLGRGLEELPGLEDALTGDDGGKAIGRVAATSIAGLATAESVDDWIEVARSASVRQLKDELKKARAVKSISPCPTEGATASSGDPTFGHGDKAETVRDFHGQLVAAAASASAEDATQKPHGRLFSGGGSAAAGDDPDGDLDDRWLVRMLLPGPVQAAFEDTLRVFRAVCGYDATVTAFVEALVAEATAGASPVDVDCVRLKRRADPQELEKQLEQAAGLWRQLGQPGRDEWIDELSEKHLREFERCARLAGTGGPAELYRQLLTLIRLEGLLSRRLGEVLEALRARGGMTRLMFRGLGHYSEERLGLARSAAGLRVHVARGLRRYPLLRKAYEDGRLRLTAASILLRILGHVPVEPETILAWIDHARIHTVKRLLDEERELKRRRLDDPGPGVPLPLSDEEWHGSLDQRRGTIYKRVAESGLRAAAGRLPDVFLRVRLPADLAGKFLSAIESRRSALSREADSVPWDQEWDPHSAPSMQAARLFSIRCRRAPAWVGLLALLEDFVATWDHPRQGVQRRSDAVYGRDGWRCAAPGCTSRQGLEDHHLRYRSRGGVNDLFNRLCLCAFHHRLGEHGQLASFTGTAPLGVTAELGHGELRARYRNEQRLDREAAQAAA